MNQAVLLLSGAVTGTGSALITFAVGAGTTPWLAVPLLFAGVGQVLVTVGMFQERTWAVQRRTVLVLLAPAIIWTTVLLVQPAWAETIPLLPALAGTSLGVLSSLLLIFALRSTSRTVSTGKFLTVLFASAGVVAAVATPAFAGTNAGEHSVPHGEHGLILEDHGH